MAKMERRNSLQLKKVGPEHLVQYNKLLRYAFQVTEKDLEESGYEEGELLRAKRPVLENAESIGWFNGDRLISQVSVYPCAVNVHGTIMPMGGLTGVGTYPEYANLGLMSDLIKYALGGMRERGEWISYLFPYSIPFYRKKGWEILTELLTFTLADTQVPKPVDVPGFIERQEVNHPDVLRTYDRFARSNHGAMLRGPIEWDEYWRWENEEERTAAVYYDANKEPAGYMLYWVERDVFHVKEMIYLNLEARHGLWNFIGAHDSMIDSVKGNNYRNEPIAFLLEDSKIVETVEPYFMGRIVDVARFLERYPFTGTPAPFHFAVFDPVAEWNHGIFGVRCENGAARVDGLSRGPRIRLDIQTLTAMLMGFRRPTYFQEIGRLELDKETLALLESCLPRASPYFSDYF